MMVMLNKIINWWIDRKVFNATVRFAREANNEWVSTIPNKTEEV